MIKGMGRGEQDSGNTAERRGGREIGGKEWNRKREEDWKKNLRKK